MAIQCWPLICFSLFFSNIHSDQTSFGDDEPIFGIEKKNTGLTESFSEIREKTLNSVNDDQSSNEFKSNDSSEEYEDSGLKKNIRNENRSINVKAVKSYLELIIKDLRRHLNHLKSLTNAKDVEVNMQENILEDSKDSVKLNTEDENVNKMKEKNIKCKVCKIISATKYTSSNTTRTNITVNESSTLNGNTNKNVQYKIVNKPNENTSYVIKNDLSPIGKDLKLAEIKTQLILINNTKENNIHVEQKINNQTRSFSIDSTEVDNLIQLLTESMIFDITDSVNKRTWDAVVSNDDEEEDEEIDSRTVQESLNKLTEKYLMKKRSDWIALLKEKWLKKPRIKSRIKNKQKTKQKKDNALS